MVYLANIDLMGSEKRKLGHWADGGAMSASYESIIPLQAIHNLAGFKKEERFVGRKNFLQWNFPPKNLYFNILSLHLKTDYNFKSVT